MEDKVIKQLLRAELRNEDELRRYSSAHNVARALVECGDIVANGVLHYLEYYDALKEWKRNRKFKTVCVGGDPVFGADVRPNKEFGVPDDMVIPDLANDIANGCSTFLRYFDTRNGGTAKRDIMTVAVHSWSSDKTYGVGWSILTERNPYGGSYTRSMYPIDAFEHGREFLLSVVQFLYTGTPLDTGLKGNFDNCFDWTNELFGTVDASGIVTNIKEIKADKEAE